MNDLLSPSPIGLGLMSGTSLDGLDMALCQFSNDDNQWKYKIISCKTTDYDNSFRQRLKEADQLDGLGLVELDRDFAAHIGQQVNAFLQEVGVRPDFIASHGQTLRLEQ